MTTNYHTAITSGAAANASTFNTPLSTLDTQLTAVSSEVTAARDVYASLDSRIDNLTLAASGTATLTNGAANAGQKVVTVDSTTGFLAGAPVAYTLAGGSIEANTVSVVNSATQLTLTTNIGSGGIANDTYIAVIPLGSVLSTGSIAGASATHQQFVNGIMLPTPTGAADHFLSSFVATFDGVVDPCTTWGYNARRGARDEAAVGVAAWSIEANYYAFAGSEMRYLAETYFATENNAGTASRRWIALTVDREDPDDYGAIEFIIPPHARGQFTIGRSDTRGTLFQFIGTGEFALWGANQTIQFTAGASLEVLANGPLTFIANSKRANMSPTVDGFEFGVDRDTNLYRSAANTLRTDKALKLGKAGANHGYLSSDDDLYINSDADNSATGNAIIFGAGRSLGSGGSEWARLQSASLGIGTASPASRLDIDAGALTMKEMSAPSAPAANSVVIYAVDNGSGKTKLMALFSTGVAQQIAIEP